MALYMDDLCRAVTPVPYIWMWLIRSGHAVAIITGAVLVTSARRIRRRYYITRGRDIFLDGAPARKICNTAIKGGIFMKNKFSEKGVVV